MALTGDLENLNIADVIQLIHTSRQSGTFSVRGSKGESRIIFSNGNIVGANYLNNRIRIGTVLVKMNAITSEDLARALEVQKTARKSRKPLITTLIEMGRLKPDDALKGLEKLVEMTLVEMIGWTQGTFTFTMEDIRVDSLCSYPISTMKQEIGLDTQMALMDAFRVFDERERDRQSGKIVPSYEELFPEVIPLEVAAETSERVLTADDLGLADLDRLERKLPRSFSVEEIFDPAEIHRRKIKDTLAVFSKEEQETFVSFLKNSATSIDIHSALKRQEGQYHALILFSWDELIRHSVMTICKDADVLVFVTDTEEGLDHFIGQCLSLKTLPVLIFDIPAMPEGIFSEGKIVSLRKKMRDKYPQIPILQMITLRDLNFALQSLNDGIRAVFPRPLRETGEGTFIKDTISFLGTLKSYIKGIFNEQRYLSSADAKLVRLKDLILYLSSLNNPTDILSEILKSTSEIFERSITLVVRPNELIGEWAIGMDRERYKDRTSAAKIKVPLTKPSIFRNVIETGRLFYGESDDGVLREHLFKEIGKPLVPVIILLPVNCNRRVVAIIYGDFGMKGPSPVQTDTLEILAEQAGLILENLFFRKRVVKSLKSNRS